MSGFDEKVSTKERLVIAAQKLFAEKGFSQVSLRDITNAAEANVAAVNYYFTSKDALADEVITRHIWPVNEARMEMLNVLRGQYAEGPIPLREILTAFMRPMVELMHSSTLRNDLFRKIMGRCMGDKAHMLPEAVEPQMKEVLQNFIGELMKALPDLTPEVVLWRLHFSFGVVAHTLLFSDRLREFSEIEVREHDGGQALDLVIDYCVGGLLAEQSDKVKGGVEK